MIAGGLVVEASFEPWSTKGMWELWCTQQLFACEEITRGYSLLLSVLHHRCHICVAIYNRHKTVIWQNICPKCHPHHQLNYIVIVTPPPVTASSVTRIINWIILWSWHRLLSQLRVSPASSTELYCGRDTASCHSFECHPHHQLNYIVVMTPPPAQLRVSPASSTELYRGHDTASCHSFECHPHHQLNYIVIVTPPPAQLRVSPASSTELYRHRDTASFHSFECHPHHQLNYIVVVTPPPAQLRVSPASSTELYRDHDTASCHSFECHPHHQLNYIVVVTPPPAQLRVSPASSTELYCGRDTASCHSFECHPHHQLNYIVVVTPPPVTASSVIRIINWIILWSWHRLLPQLRVSPASSTELYRGRDTASCHIYTAIWIYTDITSFLHCQSSYFRPQLNALILEYDVNSGFGYCCLFLLVVFFGFFVCLFCLGVFWVCVGFFFFNS